MRVKCEYCDNYILDTEENCPVCGAPNAHMMRSGDGIPKTIEELKAYALSKGLPLEQMRFFIGEDIREPKAFGIYEEEGGDFVVYKNKANGERAVRYRGSDEAYAVNELYQKLRSEVTDQKEKIAAGEGKPKKQKSDGGGKKGKGCLIALIAVIIVTIVGMVGCMRMADKYPDNGYYLYEGTYYYTQDTGGSWHAYDEFDDDWFAISDVEDELYDNWKEYKIADLKPENTQDENVQYVYYPNIQESDYWDDSDLDEYYDTDTYDNTDTYEDTDTWNDDWDDDDLDWDDSYDWDDSSSDWDSEW